MTAAAAIHESRFTVPQTNTEGSRYVFFPGDLIADDVKANNQAWRRGGILRPEAKTLSYVHGFIPRCEITELRTHFMSTAATNVHPEKRALAVRVFNAAATNPVTGEFENKTIGTDRNGQHDGLLRYRIDPVQEVGMIAQQRDGVAEIPVTSNRQMYDAQRFLFPNWDRLASGAEQFPPTIMQLRQYFVKRKQYLATIDVTENHAMFEAVVDAVILSCDQFLAWAQNLVAAANATHDQHKAKGWPYVFGSDARLAASQNGLVLRDDAQIAQDSKLDKMADAVAKLADLQLAQAAQMVQSAQSPAKTVNEPPTEQTPTWPPAGTMTESSVSEASEPESTPVENAPKATKKTR